jgi:methylthioribose-1-phosphate isomerase
MPKLKDKHKHNFGQNQACVIHILDMRVESQGADFHTVWMNEPTSNGMPLVRMIDQNRLPFEFEIFNSPALETTCEAIKDMTVRGAGAIGATAAFAMAQGFFEDRPDEARALIESTRPTAQNLFYATRFVYEAAIKGRPSDAYMAAQEVALQDELACRQIGQYGLELMPDNSKVLTHCNAGWLAFVDWGSALSPVYVAHRAGKEVFVYADMTAPRNQGGRLTAWELANEGVPHQIVPDTGLMDLMDEVRPDLVIVGADRIAANGDVANKIGTRMVALAAREFDVPFYVAAPTSTIDLATSSGKDIRIESRSYDEVTHVTGLTEDGRLETVQFTNPGSPARNRAFDVTPNKLVTAFITERGIIRPRLEDIVAVKNAA